METGWAGFLTVPVRSLSDTIPAFSLTKPLDTGMHTIVAVLLHMEESCTEMCAGYFHRGRVEKEEQAQHLGCYWVSGACHRIRIERGSSGSRGMDQGPPYKTVLSYS